jgi:hypothetical protein
VFLSPLATAALPVVSRQWRRGAAWVNFVGIDGYCRRSSDTFSNAPVLVTQRSDRNNITRIKSSI